MERKIILLAALLHDIGKFFQRADTGSTKSSKYLKPEILNLPITTHKHSFWTAQFISNHKEKLGQIIGNVDSLLTISSYHHQPSSKSEKLIQLADHYSSAQDRTDKIALKDDEDEKSWDSFKRKRMVSIFEGICRDDKYIYDYNFNIRSQSLQKDIFPTTSDNKDTEKHYSDLWFEFEEKFKLLPVNNFDLFFESLNMLLQKYLIFIPSSTMNLPDVSLYDHLKTTSAFSICLYDYLIEKNNFLDLKISNDEAPIIMIGGILSGIQKYIYTINNKYASRNLKGRSFYLDLLVQSTSKKLLTDLNLHSVNLIYSSGGTFYILAPNTKFVKNKFKEFKFEIANKIFENHKNNLLLSLDFIPLTVEEIKPLKNSNHSLGNKWVELNQLIQRQKLQKFDNIFSQNYDNFFLPFDKGGKTLKDEITNEEIIDYKKHFEDILVSELTATQIELGAILREMNYWITSDSKINYFENENYKNYNPLGLCLYHYFLPDKTFLNWMDFGISVNINKINSLDFVDNLHPKNNFSFGFTYYGGNKYPLDETGNVISHDELAGHKNLKFRRLGVLRMDVDGLGELFKNGFNKTRVTISRYSSFSRNLDYFFKGFINTIWNCDEFKTSTYILYSGGDDLFIIGKWDSVIKFSKKIKTEFTNWACFNPNLTISAGVSIVSPKHPISNAAILSEESLQLSKNHTCNNIQKNSITIFNIPLNWDFEFPIVEQVKDILVNLINNKINKSVLFKLSNYCDQSVRSDKLDWKWRLMYDISRFKKNISNEVLKSQIDILVDSIFTNQFRKEIIKSDYQFTELLQVSIKWAELELRNKN